MTPGLICLSHSLTNLSWWFGELQLDPDGVWYVPLREPAMSPLAATLALPDATSAAPPAMVSLSEKLGNVTVWPETVPETVVDGVPGI